MGILLIAIIAFFIVLYNMRRVSEDQDPWIVSIGISFALTACGVFFWLFVVMGFLGIPLTQLGLTGM